MAAPARARVLSASELQRYARQLPLPQVGPAGQARLGSARVLIVGVGGLGCPVAQYLAAAGVGRLTLADDDLVELTNLQRQPLYREADVGHPKATVAAARLAALNSSITVAPLTERVTAANVLALARDHDLVVDGTDSLAARYLLADGCHLVGVPLVHGALRRFEGQVALFPPGGPCYRCLFPRPPPPEVVEDCATAGVLGAVPGVIGTLQALAVLRWLLRLPPRQARLWLFDGRAGTVSQVALARRSDCALCGAVPTITAPADEPEACAAGGLTPAEFQAALAAPAPPLLVDLRESWERELSLIPGQELHLPWTELEARAGELPRDRELMLYCHRGLKSAVALAWLRARGFRARHLAGGMEAWTREIDPEGRLY